MARKKAPELVSLKDVAKYVGVHASTASRVLNPATRGMVTLEVASRVLAAAEELGYHPNPFALALRTRRSYTVGVVIPDITNPVFPPMVRGIETVLGAAGFTVILAEAPIHGDLGGLVLDRMKSRWVDGLILATATRTGNEAILPESKHVPVVLINRVGTGTTSLSVGNDDDEGMRLAMGHITELGHRNIAHIAGPQNTSTGHARYCGFLKAMEHHGLTVEKKFIAFSDSYSIEEGRKGALAILSLAKRPTAIVCANDLLALGCYDVLRDLKLKCPQDVSVTGFNDMPFVDRFEPPMTTVHVPTFKMGELAAKLLLEAINTPKLVRRSEMVKPTLVVRKSTGKPKSR